jgi:hypothetical protein
MIVDIELAKICLTASGSTGDEAKLLRQDGLPSNLDRQYAQLVTADYLTTHSNLKAIDNNILQIRETSFTSVASLLKNRNF